jgi:hypothetical protein
MVVPGRTTFEWLEGGHFLIGRSTNEHPDFPDSLTVLGPDGDGLSMRYFDSRGVVRTYATSLADGVWHLSRDDPDFAQRFAGTLDEGGGTITGVWQLCEDGSTWNDDLEITYRRSA